MARAGIGSFAASSSSASAFYCHDDDHDDSEPGATGQFTLETSNFQYRRKLNDLEEARGINKPMQFASGLSIGPSIYIITWICLSASVILFNKWILHNLEFDFPIFLTTWHLIFATISTRILAHTTNLLDGLHRVRITRKVYLKAILPVAFFFSLSLIFSNQAYLYLSVSFIQMLKAVTPVAVLLASWTFAIEKPNLKVLMNVSFIVLGVIIASYGEIQLDMTGFVFQICGVIFEATRLVLVQQLLSSAEYKMDPLVSLYYFAPICAAMNFIIFLYLEAPVLGPEDIARVGLLTLLANAAVAFALNVSVVFLIGKTSSLVLTLSGVLKDIILVTFSVLIWHSPITALQLFGYSIALGGLVIYKLGISHLKETLVVARGGFQRRMTTKPTGYIALLIIFLILWVLFLQYREPNLTKSSSIPQA